MISTGIAILIGILSAAIGIGIYIVAANTITKNTVKAPKFEGDVAVMDGNQGWAISCNVPRGLDPDASYYVTAVMKTDSATENVNGTKPRSDKAHSKRNSRICMR